MVSIFLTNLFLLVLGHSFLQFLWPQGKKLGWIYFPLAYFLGEYCIVIWMYFLAILGTSFSIMSIDIPLSLLAIFFYKLSRSHISSPDHKNVLEMTNAPLNKLKAVFFIIWIYVILQIAYVMWMALIVPVFEWDVVWRIGLKAKVFFFDRGIEKLKDLPYPNYALGGPFIMTWAALHAGGWHEATIRFIPATEFLMFVILFRGFLRVFLSPALALIGLGLLVSANYFTYHATLLYNDFKVSVFLCSSIFCLIIWNKFKILPFLFLGGILFSGASLFKLESSVYSFLTILLWRFIFQTQGKDFLKTILIFSLPSIGILLCHSIFCSIRGFRDESTVIKFLGVNGFFERVCNTFLTLYNQFFVSWNWNILWGILLGLFIFNFQNRRLMSECRTFGLFLGMFVGYLLLASIFTDRYRILGGSDAYQTLPRMILHFYPLVPALIVFLFASMERDKT